MYLMNLRVDHVKTGTPYEARALASRREASSFKLQASGTRDHPAGRPPAYGNLPGRQCLQKHHAFEPDHHHAHRPVPPIASFGSSDVTSDQV
jgi:hypothetical protein